MGSVAEGQRACTLVFAAVLSFLSVVTYWLWLFTSLTSLVQVGDFSGDAEVQSGRDFLYGVVALIHVSVFGLAATSFPRSELRGKDRHLRMGEQKGHTTMLYYFLGFGCVFEISKGANYANQKLLRIIRFHAVYLVSLQLGMCLYILGSKGTQNSPVSRTLSWSGISAALFLANWFGMRHGKVADA